MSIGQDLGISRYLNRSGDEPSGYFWLMKGRVALYAALRGLGIGSGDKVILPGFTCVVVPAAIEHAGATPVYADIDERTFNLDLASLKSLDLAGVKAIIVQHSYGISAGAAEVVAWARENGLFVIEDCCHVLGSTVEGVPCGRLGDAAFFSFQWSKPLTAGLGGLLVVNRPELAERVARIIEAEGLRSSFFKRARLALEYFAYSTLYTPKTALFLTATYRLLTRLGILTGSSTPEELRGGMPEGYFSLMSDFQRAVVERKLRNADRLISHRRAIAATYQKLLAGTRFRPLDPSLLENSVILRYPVRVSNRAELIERAQQKGFEIGTWFETPLHPVSVESEVHGYRTGTCPVGDRVSQQVINLPTHARVSLEDARRHVEFLVQYGKES